MSAPETNLEKQKRRHGGPLIGMVAVLLFVSVLLFGYMFFVAADAPTPDAGETPAEASQDTLTPLPATTPAPNP